MTRDEWLNVAAYAIIAVAVWLILVIGGMLAYNFIPLEGWWPWEWAYRGRGYMVLCVIVTAVALSKASDG